MAKKRTASKTDGKVYEPRLVTLLKRLNRELEAMDSLWAAHGDEIEDTLSAPHPMEGVSVGSWTSNCYANIVYLLGHELHRAILASVAVEPVHSARWAKAIIAKEFTPIATDVSHDDPEYWGRISDAVFAWEATFSKADLHQLDTPLRNEWKRTGSIEAGRLAMDLAATLAFFKSEASAAPTATSGPSPGYLNVVLDEGHRTINRVESDVAPIELSAVLWPMCKLFVDGGASGVTREQLDRLPGESSARTTAISTLRKRLTPLGLTIKDGRGGKKRVLTDDAT